MRATTHHDAVSVPIMRDLDEVSLPTGLGAKPPSQCFGRPSLTPLDGGLLISTYCVNCPACDVVGDIIASLDILTREKLPALA